MAGVRDKPANLRRGIAPIRGGIIDELNDLSRVVAKLDPESGIQAGLGTRLARELNRPISILNARVEAQTGRRGPVVIAKQTKKPIDRKIQVAADFNDQPVTGIGFPEKGTDAINLDYFRRFLNCDWFEKMFDECIEDEERVAHGAGIVHAFWGYTYEIPNFTDTVDGDPGVSESSQGSYWQVIVPETTIVDRVTFLGSQGLPPIAVGPCGFAIYDLNVASNSAPRLAMSETIEATGLTSGGHTLALDSRLTLEAGMYAVAYIGPCFDIVCINGNTPVWEAINALWEPFHRYGIFATDGTYPDGTFPSELNTDNVLPGPANPSSNYYPYTNPVPLTYFDDSAEF